MDKQKIYFPNLNGLRFIAASVVIIHHIEQFKSFFYIESYWGVVPFIGIIGKLGVVLFFVLSGFLITYLLLAEEHSFQTISIRNFYIRRMLRIWPLYYLIIILAFLVLPNISLFTLPGYGKEAVYNNLFLKLVLYCTLFPNLVFSFVPYASHMWSIGTEEQYYLVWPIVVKYFKRHRIYLMLFISLAYLFIKWLLSSDYSVNLSYKYRYIAGEFLSNFSISCMAIGGIFAILLFQKSIWLKYLLNNYLFYITLAVVIFLLIRGIYFPFIQYEVYSFLFGVLIINLAANSRIKISLENASLNYLGKISYGLYMYHPIGIVLTIVISLFFNVTSNWLIYPLSFLLTIILASISYTYFETFFLRLKKQFTVILSASR